MTAATTKKDWREKRTSKLLVTSASQQTTFDLCPRKWWLENVRGFDVPSTTSQVFGTVLHSVCERYLRADDLGRDPKTGKPVDLFPTGWHVAESRFGKPSEGEITPDEQDRLRRMIDAAIDQGVLERSPGRVIEKQFRKPVLVTDENQVQIMGFVDVVTNDCVQDHKTSKNRRYLKSRDALREDTQMLIYAKILLMDIEESGAAMPTAITLRHNGYLKDPDDPHVRKTEVQVTPAEINAEWDRIKANCEKMLLIRRTANTWSDIPEPAKLEEACNAYGGCPYRPICSGRESEQGFEQRLARNQSGRYTPITANGTNPTKGQPAMTTFDSKLAGKMATRPGGTAPPINPPAPRQAPQPVFQPKPSAEQHPMFQQPQQAPQQAQQTAAVENAPPWADALCKACGGSGFNTQGQPCRICDGTSTRRGVPASHLFVIEAIGDGTFVWEARDGMSGGQVAAPSAAAPVTTAQRVQQPMRQPAPTPPLPVTGIIEEFDKGKPGRPKKGFILCINCAPIRGEDRTGSGRACFHLDQELVMIGKKIAEASNPPREHFVDVDVFARRDALVRNAEKIADRFGADMVVATGIGSGQSDLKALVDAIRPLAGMVIVGEPV